MCTSPPSCTRASHSDILDLLDLPRFVCKYSNQSQKTLDGHWIKPILISFLIFFLFVFFFFNVLGGEFGLWGVCVRGIFFSFVKREDKLLPWHWLWSPWASGALVRWLTGWKVRHQTRWPLNCCAAVNRMCGVALKCISTQTDSRCQNTCWASGFRLVALQLREAFNHSLKSVNRSFFFQALLACRRLAPPTPFKKDVLRFKQLYTENPSIVSCGGHC